MFNTLASYLLGNSISSSSTCGTKKEQEEKHDNRTGDADSPSADQHNLLHTVADDDYDDWLLVERDNIAEDDVSLPRTDSEEELPIVEIKNSPLVTKARHNRHAEPPNVVGLTSMEESWFVTPPSCFTGTQGPIHMETSPLENLLIEHPSMSVYHSIRGPSQPIENDMVVLNYEAEENQPHPADERIVNHSHEKNIRQKLCRNALIRSNKTNEVNAKNGRQKRSDKQHSKNASRANNNRKC
ncbi:tumor protein p53-inducible nuclear protein 2 isoform X2 [Phlebotomus argentipes]|uniref:tumor protein p53-inducible nuclear protein 2 isoform X2 n=1 Tax=Phlebotomus argentipes TaxID=94469 RepID=UPI00289332E7|nr:tumor protein p53-inducible nuclear protein 2 isoform X2 [Phlebotomus argentipes]